MKHILWRIVDDSVILSREAVTLPLGGSVYLRVDAPGWRVLPVLTLQATQGRNALGLGLLLLPGVQQRTGPGLVAAVRAQGGGNQRQPCGPGFHLPASKRCKQTLSPCQAAAAPSSRPQTAPLTCEAEPQHSQGGGHTHTRAARSTQHLLARQLAAGLSVMEGCLCL